MKVTVLLKSPFLDKIPSLKNLVLFLSQKGVDVKIISTKHPVYPECSIEDNHIKMIRSCVRTKKIQMPTTIGLGWNVLKDLLFNRSDIYIGADSPACKILLCIRKFIKFRYWNFLLEYPNIDNSSELETLINAKKIITHDKWHSDFLNRHCGTRQEQFLYLPNSTFTNECRSSSDYLHRRLNLPLSEKILLHSGGLGVWFLCRELAFASDKLSKGYRIVFHTSHDTTGSDYYRQIKEAVDTKKLPVAFSLKPVSNEELDTLVASAYIGFAFYSVEELGYRAVNMGLAAGKIGNYLKCGVPVICTRLPSLKYIEDYKCGVLIDNFDELPDAVACISGSYDTYKANAYKCYENLWEPTEYLHEILREIQALG